MAYTDRQRHMRKCARVGGSDTIANIHHALSCAHSNTIHHSEARARLADAFTHDAYTSARWAARCALASLAERLCEHCRAEPAVQTRALCASCERITK